MFPFFMQENTFFVIIPYEPSVEKYVQQLCSLTWTVLHHCHFFLLFLFVGISVQPQFGLSDPLGIWIRNSFTFVSLNPTYERQRI